jgi:chondroitin-sulfate-ABC endolyase/exolyase
MKRAVLFFLSLLLLGVTYSQGFKEYNHSAIFSFEEPDSRTSHDAHSTLSITCDHYKHLSSSLKWSWSDVDSYWSIHDEVAYTAPLTDSAPRLCTFVFWIYSKEPITNGHLKVEFLKKGKVTSHFEYGLDFSGWRGAWVAFDRDMEGQPEEGMDEVRFSVPGVNSGTLFFDHVILASMQDARHHTADFQAPFINVGTRNHWLILNDSWNKVFDEPLKLPSEKEVNDALQIANRLKAYFLDGVYSKPLPTLREEVEAYGITENDDGTLRGVPIFFERFGETYEMFGAGRYHQIYNNLMGVEKFNTTLLHIAIAHHQSEIPYEKSELESLFMKMIRHMLDQGFQAGSAMGTLHHSGYSMESYYPALFLMLEPLERHGLRAVVQQAAEWFAGTGEVREKPLTPGMDVDTFNTNLIARLTSILMIESEPEKVRYLHAFRQWLDNGYQYADGTRGTFKIDGTMFHHRHHYPAYAIGGFQGAVEAIYLLRGTTFKISERSHRILKDALLSMRVYCNLRTWPLSLSGRHPDGRGQLIPEHYGLLAFAGSPDGLHDVDTDMAAAYLRLVDSVTTRSRELIEMGFSPEKSPSGNWTFNYSNLSIHRRDDWMVSAMGHSRYLWSSEGYRGENLFGRYMTHGSMQILATGNPISNEGSGFRQEGWDWNHFPGTTATVLPIERLKADVKNLDDVSGFEEMLLSDESFSGGISLGGEQGAFGMKLHENDKYNGSLRARKSFFFFDNRVIALGSQIESALPEETHTTLFQTYLEEVDKPFFLNGQTDTRFPYLETLPNNKVNVLSDGLNNLFFVNQGEVMFKKGEQHSFHEESGLPTRNNFALASINHGSRPSNGTYEYMILVQPDVAEKERTYANALAGKFPYDVLRHDSLAHVVKDLVTYTTGYVLFEAGKVSSDVILHVSHPILAMTQKMNGNQLLLAVCDPDLRLYEGPADELYDENGKTVERSVYSREWINNPSGISFVKVTLAGHWKIGAVTPYAKVVTSAPGQTSIEFECQHGMPREVLLLRGDNQSKGKTR